VHTKSRCKPYVTPGSPSSPSPSRHSACSRPCTLAAGSPCQGAGQQRPTAKTLTRDCSAACGLLLATMRLVRSRRVALSATCSSLPILLGDCVDALGHLLDLNLSWLSCCRWLVDVVPFGVWKCFTYATWNTSKTMVLYKAPAVPLHKPAPPSSFPDVYI